MRERATLFTISAVAILAILFAIQRHQKVGSQRESFEEERGSLKTTIQDLESKLLECSKVRDSALDKVQTLATEVEGLKANTGDSSQAIVGKIDAFQKEWTDKEAALQSALTGLDEKVAGLVEKIGGMEAQVTGLDGKVDTAVASVAAVQKEVTTPESALLTKLDQVVKLSESTAKVPEQITALDGKLQALDTMVADVAALSQRLTEVQGAVETGLAGVAQGGSGSSEQTAQQLAELSAQIAVLVTTLDSQKESLSALGAEVRALLDRPAVSTGTASTSPTETAPITTIVKAATDAVVVIAAGKADGVQLGQLLYVLRDGTPVARIRVINAYDHLAGAKIVETVEGRVPQKEDSVTSRSPAGWDSLNAEAVVESEETAPTPSTAPPPPPPSAVEAPSVGGGADTPPPPPPPAPEG